MTNYIAININAMYQTDNQKLSLIDRKINLEGRNGSDQAVRCSGCILKTKLRHTAADGAAIKNVEQLAVNWSDCTPVRPVSTDCRKMDEAKCSAEKWDSVCI